MYFDSRVDGVNWVASPTAGFVLPSGISEYHSAKVNARYFRVRLVNGSGAQSYLRLYTYFGPHTHPSAPLNQTLGADAAAMVVRTTDPKIDKELGRLGGVQSRSKFGYTPTVGASVVIGTPATWVHCWAYGGQRTAPTASFTPYLASSSTADTAVTYSVEYLDANGVAQTATGITLTGRTGKSVGVTATDVSRIWNDGSTNQVGQVTCTIADNFTDGVPTNQNEVVAAAPAADQQSTVMAFRVPASTKCILDEVHASCVRDTGADTSVVAMLQTREPGGVWRTREPLMMATASPVSQPLSGITLTAGTDVRMEIRDVSDNGTNVACTLNYTLVEV